MQGTKIIHIEYIGEGIPVACIDSENMMYMLIPNCDVVKHTNGQNLNAYWYARAGAHAIVSSNCKAEKLRVFCKLPKEATCNNGLPRNIDISQLSPYMINLIEREWDEFCPEP